jgi:hypothetical protein
MEGTLNTLIIIAAFVVIIYASIIFLIIRRMLDKTVETITKHESNVSEVMRRISVMFESTNQRVIVLNNRIRDFYKYFGINEIQDMKKASHYIKNNVSKNKGNKKRETYSGLY